MKPYQVKAMIAIFAASLLCQSVNALSLVLQGIIETYPQTTVTTAQLVISVANLVGLASMLIVGKAVCYVTKKNALLAMMICLVCGALLGRFATPNLVMVFVACGIVGFGAGGLIPLATALIGEHFDGELRATVMGTQSLFVNGGGMLLQLGGGFLAATYWKDLFFAYVPAVVIALIVLFLLPRGELEKPTESDGPVKVFTPFLGVMMVQGFFVGLAMMVFISNITFYVFELGLGDESQAGIITMAFSGGAVVFGILIAFMMKLCRRRIFAVGLTLMALALWLFATTSSFAVFVIGGILAGAGFTLHNTSYYSLAPANANPAAMTMTISLYTVAMQGGMILCPLIVNPIAGMFGASLSSCFVVGAVVTTVIAVVAYFTPLMLRKYKLSF